MLDVTFSHAVTFGPSETSVGSVKNVVDGGNGATASTSHAIDYYLVKPFLWLETGRQDSKAVCPMWCTKWPTRRPPWWHCCPYPAPGTRAL
mmetsp:Transcript_21518/g.36315  ORF Transcript_21518/g.36315 Transcript_21518/m.36315 type:complete len:91 (+) Transcript_21518:149-421(+)